MKRRIVRLSFIATTCLSLAVTMPQPAAAAVSLKKLVLSPRDVPASLGSFRVMPRSPLRLPSGASIPASTRHAHGFQESFGSFLISANGASSGMLLIDDGVLRFAADGGAHWFLGATKKGAILTGDSVAPVSLGSEGIIWTQVGSTGSIPIYLFWRHGPYVGEVTAIFRSHVRRSDVIELAQILDRKIAAAG